MAMTDHEIHECVDKKVATAVKAMEKTVDKYTEAITFVITDETQNIRKSINELRDQVKEQNGSVRGLKEWRAHVEGEKYGADSEGTKSGNAWTRVLQVIGVVVALGSMFLLYRNSEKKKWNDSVESIKAEIRANTQPSSFDRSGLVYDPIAGRVYMLDSINKKKVQDLIDELDVK